MSVVNQVKDRLDIVEVVQSYVPLKKAGRTYKGLCPFHAEKTPSFVVFPETGTWHCFGACDTGGDLFTFVMMQENLDFGEALRVLAKRAGVELEPRSPEAAAAEKRRDLLREINHVAATYFHHLLLSRDEAAPARAYLEKRGLNRDTLDRFQVGYALDQRDNLLRYMTNKGYALADLQEAGLVIERDDGSGFFDYFRGRVLFPINDYRGRTIGFGGRVLGDGIPKYLNSRRTPLFDKSSALFGLDQARAGIRTSGEATIVEGYMDVLQAHQHGIDNVVAQMGTALTEAQLKLLKRYTQRFVLALDSDAAGNQATLRGLDVARQVMDREVVPVPTPRGLIRFEERLSADIRIVSLPKGRDPDEVIRESPAQWAQLIAQARPVMDYYFHAMTADLDLASAKGKAEAVRALGPLLVEIGDRVQRTHYLQQLSRMVQVDERALWQQIRQETGRKPPSQPARPKPAVGQADRTPLGLDEYCLAFALRHPDLITLADAALQDCGEEALGAKDLGRPEDQAILAAWQHWLAKGVSRDAQAEFYDTVDEHLQERITTLLKAQQDQPLAPDRLVRNKVVDAVTRLRLQNLQHEIYELRFLIEDEQESQAAASYGPLITRATARIRCLEQAMNERANSKRRQQEDVTGRVPPTVS
jgi:DNA primase